MASSFLVRPGAFGSQKISAVPRMIRRDAGAAPDEFGSEPGIDSTVTPGFNRAD